ncbi:FAD-binding protein [Antarcticibacterium flavum]|uniref:FAD-binding protein n=1 Tax=Antarcticibacterium flavum TaxID=2058175 RepID=A0A5B7WY74_9FLAO|nr:MULTISPECIES: D-arabinono-1,4-lactone oxidase [Antarcticibacterium]MCM4160839.1 oxidoreductase [Antarcticibacterium sp. W02-3]QCY68007.1 FAD-binding protein [Antarcticibacterium flavum]
MEKPRWKNWSGSLSFSPGEIATPESEEEVVDLVKAAAKENRKIRVVGAGHSSSPLVKTRDVLLSMKHFRGAGDLDEDSGRLSILSGMTVKEAGKEAFRYGLAMHNTGDVDVQTIAGAIGTGTHGTGVELKNLSSMLAGVRMVTGKGEILEASIDDDKDLFRALQVAMGTCGIFLKMRLKLKKAYRLHRKEWCVPIEKCLENLEDLKKNRNFDFYWYPRSDLAKIRVMNEEGREMPEISYGSLEMDKKGNSHEILPRSRHLKFDEMEYVLPADKAIDCFLEVRDLIKKHWRKEIGWRVLVRTIQADDVYISPMTGRESVTISLHHNAGMRFWDYFQAIEPVFIKFGGRPHWGKKHTLKAAELREMYPNWNKFREIREKMDPDGIFLTPYMKELLIAE